MPGIAGLPEVTTLASGDYIPVVAGGVTSKISLANLQKLVGGSGGSAATVATNLLTGASDLTSQANWFQYDSTNQSIAREGPLLLKGPSDGGGHVVYQAIPVASGGKLVVGQTYTFGFTATRTAGSGTGKVRSNVYYEGAGAGPNAADQTVTDGTAYRSSVTFTVPAGATNAHVGIDFTAGGGEFAFSKLTLVAGSTDNPNAT